MSARTIKRLSLPLNAGKRARIETVIGHFAAEKAHWLRVFQSDLALLHAPEKMRDQARKDKHAPVGDLPGVVWPLALKEAAETMDKYWAACFVPVRRLIHHNANLAPEQKRYAYRILNDYRCLAALFAREDIAEKTLSDQQRHQVRYDLNRIIARHRGALPRVKLARSIVLDKCSYTIDTHEGKQALCLSRALCGAKLWIPLKGLTDLTRPSARLDKHGQRNRAWPNIRLVLQGEQLELHYAASVKAPESHEGDVTAIDFGYTEVIVDSDGAHHGEGFGARMSEATEQRTDKGRKRGKLRALAEKYQHQGKHKKARNIRRYNLGQTKQRRTRTRQQAALEHHINTALNTVIDKTDVLISENLSARFHYRSSPTWNRRLSAWVRGRLQTRTEFKALAGCSGHQQVNPAYTSQTCPACGYVHRANRHFDTFQCGHCGFAAHADEVAALNLLARATDPDITLFTPYGAVKEVLESRFRRRQECNGPARKRCRRGPLTAGLEIPHEEAGVIKPRPPELDGHSKSEKSADQSILGEI
jgi:hypothetical protein